MRFMQFWFTKDMQYQVIKDSLKFLKDLHDMPNDFSLQVLSLGAGKQSLQGLPTRNLNILYMIF